MVTSPGRTNVGCSKETGRLLVSTRDNECRKGALRNLLGLLPAISCPSFSTHPKEAINTGGRARLCAESGCSI